MADDSALTPRAPDRVPVRFGEIPATIDEAWRIALIFAKSRIVPEAMRERPEDVFVAMQLGAELGLSPTNAVQTIAVINGRAGIFGDGFLAVIMRSPVYVAHEEYFEVQGKRAAALDDEALKDPTTAAVCVMWRRGVDEPLTRRFSIGDARRAGLTKKSGPWQEYPARMLMYRARGFAGRDLFPDVLKGIVPGEEAADVTPPPPPAQVRRLSDARPVAERIEDIRSELGLPATDVDDTLPTSR
jgi:hypothetical protein